MSLIVKSKINWVLTVSDERNIRVTGIIREYHASEDTVDYSRAMTLLNGANYTQQVIPYRRTKVDVILEMFIAEEVSPNIDKDLCLTLEDKAVIAPVNVEEIQVFKDKLTIQFINFKIYKSEEDAHADLMTNTLMEA